MEDAAAGRRAGKDAADRKSSRPWSASGRDLAGRGTRPPSQGADGRTQGIRPSTASTRRKPT